jgi:hypothetical protein
MNKPDKNRVERALSRSDVWGISKRLGLSFPQEATKQEPGQSRQGSRL